MKKILLVLVTLMLSYMPVQAEDDSSEFNASLTFNNTNFDTGAALGLVADDDYYMILIFDTESSENDTSARFISAILYIPTDLLVNGTHDLAILKPSKQSSSITACSDDLLKFTLPSNNKVYIALADTSLGASGNYFVSKGIVATSDDGSGSITFRDISTSSGVTNVAAEFAIHTVNSKYSAKIPVSGLGKTCKATLKNTIVKITKNSGSSDNTGSFETAIVDFPDDEEDDEEDERVLNRFQYLGFPMHQVLKNK